MKNLKKLLSVVLVIVLAVGLMATASAANVADYPDADDVNYTEAVDLFTALGFLQGRDTGKFDPQGLVTREEAAKIITYMLIGSSRADALTTTVSDFSDVALGRWSAPFIQYCATQGIINGMGDGTFNPTGNVTGAQFAKMLLCSVGYGVKDEYTGSNWAMKTIADATNLGILSLDVDYSAGATREEVSQYGFNAYTNVKTVVWNSVNQAYQQATDIDGKSAKGPLAEQQKVAKSADYVSNGVTYYKWLKNDVAVTGGYTRDKILGTNMDGYAINLLATRTFVAYIAPLASDVSVVYNGTTLVPYADGTTTNIGKGVMYYNTTKGAIYTTATGGTGVPASAADTAFVVGKGMIVNFISTDGDGDAEKVMVTNKAVYVLGGNPVVNTAAGTVTIPGICYSQLFTNVPGYDTLKDKDVVLWYKDALGVYHIDKATSVTGTLDRYVAGTSVTVADTTYKYSALSGTILNTTVEGYNGLPDSTFYFDDGGYLVYVTQTATAVAATNYAFVISTEKAGYNLQAKCVLSDGTTKIVTVDPATATTSNTLWNNGNSTPSYDKFEKFAETSDGVYKFTLITVENGGAGVAIGSEAPTGLLQNTEVHGTAATTYDKITKGSAKFLTYVDTNTSANNLTTKLVANSKTVFVYKYDATSTYAYDGIANAPSFTSDVAAETIYCLYKDLTAIFVYADTSASAALDKAFVPSTTTGDYVYIMDTNVSVATISPGLFSWTYNALVDGKETTVKTTSALDAFNDGVGLYKVTGYNKDGYATLAYSASVDTITNPTVAHYPVLTGSTLKISGGNITANGADYFVLNSAAKYYVVDTTTVATLGKVTSYPIAAAQVSALPSTGYTVDIVPTSTSDASVSAVYIYIPSFTAAAAAVTDPTGNLSVTATLTNVSGALATYSVTITGNEWHSATPGTQNSTLTLALGSWTSAPAAAGVSTSGLVTTITDDTQGINCTGTFTVVLTGNNTPQPTLVLAEND